MGSGQCSGDPREAGTVHAWKKLLPGKSSWLETALAWKMSIPKWFPFAHGIKPWLD